MKALIGFFITILTLYCSNLLGQTKASSGAAANGSFIPPGVIMPYAGSTAPSGWVFAYGQEVSQTSDTYKKLYAAIGTTYCSAEHGTAGATCAGGNFRLPDLRGRSIHGKDNMGGIAASRITSAATIDGTVLGKSGGAQTNTLASNNIPQLSTAYTPAGSVGGSDGTHSHSMESLGSPSSIVESFLNSYNTYSSGPANWKAISAWNNTSNHSHTIYTTGSGHGHGFNGTLATITVGTLPGSLQAVNNLTPTTVMNYIIKL